MNWGRFPVTVSARFWSRRARPLCPAGRILVYGPDLADIRQDCSFARIAILRTDNIAQNGEQAAFAILREIETRKYGVYPEGYMIRAAAFFQPGAGPCFEKGFKSRAEFLNRSEICSSGSTSRTATSRR